LEIHVFNVWLDQMNVMLQKLNVQMDIIMIKVHVLIVIVKLQFVHLFVLLKDFSQVQLHVQDVMQMQKLV